MYVLKLKTMNAKLLLIRFKFILVAFFLFATGNQSISQNIQLPYVEDFESDSGDWVASGTTPSWEYGTPNNTYIANAAKGQTFQVIMLIMSILIWSHHCLIFPT